VAECYSESKPDPVEEVDTKGTEVSEVTDKSKEDLAALKAELVVTPELTEKTGEVVNENESEKIGTDNETTDEVTETPEQAAEREAAAKEKQEQEQEAKAAAKVSVQSILNNVQNTALETEDDKAQFAKIAPAVKKYLEESIDKGFIPTEETFKNYLKNKITSELSSGKKFGNMLGGVLGKSPVEKKVEAIFVKYPEITKAYTEAREKFVADMGYDKDTMARLEAGKSVEAPDVTKMDVFEELEHEKKKMELLGTMKGTLDKEEVQQEYKAFVDDGGELEYEAWKEANDKGFGGGMFGGMGKLFSKLIPLIKALFGSGSLEDAWAVMTGKQEKESEVLTEAEAKLKELEAKANEEKIARGNAEAWDALLKEKGPEDPTIKKFNEFRNMNKDLIPTVDGTEEDFRSISIKDFTNMISDKNTTDLLTWAQARKEKGGTEKLTEENWVKLLASKDEIIFSKSGDVIDANTTIEIVFSSGRKNSIEEWSNKEIKERFTLPEGEDKYEKYKERFDIEFKDIPEKLFVGKDRNKDFVPAFVSLLDLPEASWTGMDPLSDKDLEKFNKYHGESFIKLNQSESRKEFDKGRDAFYTDYDKGGKFFHAVAGEGKKGKWYSKPGVDVMKESVGSFAVDGTGDHTARDYKFENVKAFFNFLNLDNPLQD